MIRILFGFFLVLHGLVHLLYLGQCARYFELQPGMIWPDGSWALKNLFKVNNTRNLASIVLLLAAIGFISGGAGIFMRGVWWRPFVAGTAVISIALYILLWDGALESLADKGGVGVLINLAILTALLIFHWPDFDF